uniref:Helicase C-terminal domain-containing protein n=1 Tax=Solanum lycopersicum TaxID=4081 RepID=A0A3Q7HLY2_SOLLC
SYLKLFPKCRPVVIAPSNLLLHWKTEFQKWMVDIPFHNLNKKNFFLKEDEGTLGVFHCLSSASAGLSKEGHTARNENNLVWKALKKVETEKRVLLYQTPFQNNIKELYNTLCVVSPKIASDLEQKWFSLSSSIDKNARELEKLKDIRSPFVHKCSKNVKKVSLPRIRDTIIHLKPTELQNELLKRVPENPRSFYEENLMSLISVHLSLVTNRKELSELESQLKERRCRLDVDIGVKLKFVIELIRICGWWKERVIIFSQLLDPLNLIMKQLNSLFSWTLGREILYMDGKLDVNQHQISINYVNDPKSDFKVLLAVTKAFSEGISLIGTSRVVLLDVLWNPSVEQQAISRVYRNEENTSCSVSEDNILECMSKHEGHRHIFEKQSHAPHVVPTTCFYSGSQPSKGSS